MADHRCITVADGTTIPLIPVSFNVQYKTTVDMDGEVMELGLA